MDKWSEISIWIGKISFLKKMFFNRFNITKFSFRNGCCEVVLYCLYHKIDYASIKRNYYFFTILATDSERKTDDCAYIVNKISTIVW